jgi:hypothetical protein
MLDPNTLDIYKETGIYAYVILGHDSGTQGYSILNKKTGKQDKRKNSLREGKYFYNYAFDTKGEAEDFLKKMKRKSKLEKLC